MTPDAIEALEIKLFIDAIHARYGYDLRGYATTPMQRRVLTALERSDEATLGALQHSVLVSPQKFAEVLSVLTIRVSEMFRDPACFRGVREQIVPILRTYPRLRVWHAGCASGEEVYSLAIVLAECGLDDRTEIFATDLSAHALEEARAGAYPAERLQSFVDNYRAAGGVGDVSRFYTEAYGGFAMSESLRRNITWLQHDLVTDGVFAEVQLLFCRNVLIYFGDELRERVLGKLAASLCPGGFLCLGASERLAGTPLAGSFDAFVPAARIYRHNR